MSNKFHHTKFFTPNPVVNINIAEYVKITIKIINNIFKQNNINKIDKIINLQNIFIHYVNE
jgi:hypothetical protein